MTSWFRHFLPALLLLAATGCNFGTEIHGGGGTGVEGLSGVLVDGGGAPVPGAVVKAYAADDAHVGTLARRAAMPEAALDSAVTNHRGLFDLKRLAPGTYNLIAMIRIGDTTFALHRPHIVYGGGVRKLGTDTLRPAGGTSLQVLKGDSLVAGATCRIPGTPYHVRADELGACVFELLPPGVFSIVVSHPGYAPMAYEGVYVDPGVFSGCGSLDIATAEAIRVPEGWMPINFGKLVGDPLIVHAPPDFGMLSHQQGLDSRRSRYGNDSFAFDLESGLVPWRICAELQPCPDTAPGFTEETFPLSIGFKAVLIRHAPDDSTNAVLLYVVDIADTRPWRPVVIIRAQNSGATRQAFTTLAYGIFRTLSIWRSSGDPPPAPDDH